MGMKRMLVSRSAPALLLALSLAASATAKTNVTAKPANIRIGNFGQINHNYYRGAQPEPRDYVDLAALGVKTVIDLTEDGRSEEKGLVEAAGMKFYRIPMTTTDRPSEATITQFLKLVNDTANQPVFVHCQGGRHRTGVMTAVYRMTRDGWTAEQAYQEMKQYNFEGFPGHPELKNFVYAYYTHIGDSRIAGNTAVLGTNPNTPLETATK
jgi:protein tyrosine/serine phosphatase